MAVWTKIVVSSNLEDTGRSRSNKQNYHDNCDYVRTSAKEVMFFPDFVCLFICVSAR